MRRVPAPVRPSPRHPRRPTRATSSPRIFSWIRKTAAAVAKISTNSGRAPRTTSPRSTISSTGKPSNTFRTSQARVPASGAPGVTITRFSSTAVSTGPSRNRSIRRRRAGLGCMSCHAIVHVGSSMGNNDFTVEYPPLHEIASSHNRYLQAVDTFLTYLAPQPHRQTFLKPFMKEAEFCSACHKVHLDVPVNEYRWFRGFDDYDNWQASGVSGQGARSFYYPDKSMACADCHMPLVASRDPGNLDGKVHSHRFAAANTAVAYVNQDASQLEATKKFLQSGFITVDIFAVSPVEDAKGQPAMLRRADNPVAANTTFAVGEESEQSAPALIREVGKIAAPIDASGAVLEPGKTARVDVVVRTRKIGHFFPAGTVDAFDVWLELQAD